MNRFTALALVAFTVPFAAVGCEDEAGRILEPGAASGPEVPTSPARTPPRADAGPDLTYVDLDEDGVETVVLNGCGCRAGGGEISHYDWRAHSILLEGTIGDDGCSLVVDLGIGRYVITLTVTDEEGLTDTDRVAVDVRTRYPVIAITAPNRGSVFATGTPVRFQVLATDWRDEPIDAEQLSWTSDVDGELGTGKTITLYDLSRANHVITVTGTDGDGFSSSATTKLLVSDPPSVTILSPAEGSSHAVLDDVYYTGECTDSEGAPVTGPGLHWVEPRPCMADVHDMHCGVSYYVPGTDTTTLRCTDPWGLASEATVMIEVYVSYARNIEPYLVGFGCTECHGAARQDGGIRLDSYISLTTGSGESGPLIVAGDATQGTLMPRLQAEHYDPDPETILDHVPWVWMPLEAIESWWTNDILAHWIDAGAQDN